MVLPSGTVKTPTSTVQTVHTYKRRKRKYVFTIPTAGKDKMITKARECYTGSHVMF